jgi:hypothetical protein
MYIGSEQASIWICDGAMSTNLSIYRRCGGHEAHSTQLGTSTIAGLLCIGSRTWMASIEAMAGAPREMYLNAANSTIVGEIERLLPFPRPNGSGTVKHVIGHRLNTTAAQMKCLMVILIIIAIRKAQMRCLKRTNICLQHILVLSIQPRSIMLRYWLGTLHHGKSLKRTKQEGDIHVLENSPCTFTFTPSDHQ